MVARSHFRSLDKNSIKAQENSSITQGINVGTSRFLEKVNSGILRRTRAGNDIYMTNKFSTLPVLSGKSGRRLNAMPISRNIITIAKFSII